ncbi:uncharacterized protein Dwil_GK23168 [Drosophila willistoni]|uniref:purine-nucleoside phosphorylase n=1 Tax=Drosophila willistoni TaxID=7260 RepID=B4NMK8_DROWI|nr:purine nucleoside phosphorylase [Drosophila willistoni]EDW85597.1 uncharacterized protein Dwil_GK23168 [Drosophila willistoni]
MKCQQCCASKSPLARRLQLKKQKEAEEAEAKARPKQIVVTPQSLLYNYDDVSAMAEYILRTCRIRPKFGVVCSTVLSSMVNMIENPVDIPFRDIPQFPVSPVDGHDNKLVVGTLMGATVIAMQGRIHAYEGFELASCTVPVHVMKLCGVKYVFFTSAAGAVNPGYAVGDIMLIKDHINLFGMMGSSPLIGRHDSRFGGPCVSMVNAYDNYLLERGMEIGKSLGYQECLRTGVFACLGSPSYETEAEQKILSLLGVDAVGMSLVHEVIVAHHCGLRVFSFVLITVSGFGEDEDPAVVNPESFLRQQQYACNELIARLIYDIQNDL